MNVPLAKIATNTELQSVFFDNRYSVYGENVPIKVRVTSKEGMAGDAFALLAQHVALMIYPA